MHTLEIKGRPIAIMNADEDTATDWFDSESFKADLVVFEDRDGKSLWDGKSELFVRRSFAEEVAEFERFFAKALADGADPEDEDGFLVFLLPIGNLKD